MTDILKLIQPNLYVVHYINDFVVVALFIFVSFQDFLCSPVAASLKKSLKYLEEKVKLELKLSGMNVGLWETVLKYNIESTTHAFSLQGTETTDFSEPEIRWAYAAVYTPAHASIIYDTVNSLNIGQFPWKMPNQQRLVIFFASKSFYFVNKLKIYWFDQIVLFLIFENLLKQLCPTRKWCSPYLEICSRQKYGAKNDGADLFLKYGE